MKSAHRHQLETNILAKRLESYIERYRPYLSTIVGVAIALVLLMLAWSYLTGASAARRSGAWDAYNQAVGAMPTDLAALRATAQEHPNTKMQQMADVTWADGQVWTASHNYLYNRKAATKALEDATSAYLGVIESSDDKRLVNRARLGLARVYEMQSELEKAREQYLQVEGGYAAYAKQQAERLAKPESKEAYAWLATAQPPQPQTPMGPGTPGQRPVFAPGDVPLPSATPTDPAAAPGTSAAGDSFEELVKGLDLGDKPGDTADRYPTDQPPTTGTESAPANQENSPADEPKATETPASDGTTPSESNGQPPASEKPAE